LGKSVDLPQLPKRGVIRSFAQDDIEKRRSELERYISDLLVISDVIQSDELSSFLLGNLEDVFKRSLNNQAMYKQSIHSLKEVQEERSSAIAELDAQKSLMEELNLKLLHLVKENERLTDQVEKNVSCYFEAESRGCDFSAAGNCNDPRK